jgi:hypothetical protein
MAETLESRVLVGPGRACLGLRDSSGALSVGIVTLGTSKEGAQSLQARALVQHPGTVLPWRVVANVLAMTALQQGYPLEFGVLLEPGNTAVHALDGGAGGRVGWAPAASRG